jgi:hypothetical protein
LGWATITHPFHPLRNQQFEILKTRRVAGVTTLILRHPQLGSYTVAREWTDLDLPCNTSPRKLKADALLELVTLLTAIEPQTGKEVDE